MATECSNSAKSAGQSESCRIQKLFLDAVGPLMGLLDNINYNFCERCEDCSDSLGKFLLQMQLWQKISHIWEVSRQDSDFSPQQQVLHLNHPFLSSSGTPDTAQEPLTSLRWDFSSPPPPAIQSARGKIQDGFKVAKQPTLPFGWEQSPSKPQ